MTATARVRSGARWLGAAVAAAAGAYAAYAGVTFLRYGHAAGPSPEEEDPLLDRFMPAYDIVERHRTRVRAPASATFDAACNADLFGHPVVRALFRTRELILGADAAARGGSRGLLAEVQSMGWVVLAEVPGREVVVGSVTKPWEAKVTFRSLPPAEFAAFAEPDYVKIAWTLRADPIGSGGSIFRTETRAVATDRAARAKFRRYWSFLSPGIIAIRWLSLGPLKTEAERRVASRVEE
jgi:hypothetical protein